MSHNACEKLKEYISQKWLDPDLQIEDFKELSSGWSRTTYSLTVHSKKMGQVPLIVQVEGQDVVLGSRVEQDYSILKSLENTSVPVPKVYLMESDENWLGGAFIIQERVKGRAYDPFNRSDRSILASHWEQQSPLPSNVLDGLIAVHNTPLDRVDFLPSALSAEKTGEYEIERCRQIARHIGVDKDPYVVFALYWLKQHCPSEGWLTLIHGDFHARNLLIEDHHLAAILDWELTRISNPLFDLAYMCIPYLSGKFFTPGSPYAVGLIPKEWLVLEYERRTGRRIDRDVFQFWRVLATLSLLLIIETGLTTFEKDPSASMRLAWLRFLEPVLREDLLELLQ